MKVQSSILFLAVFGLHIAAYGQINSYPYTEDFESGAGSWTSGGTNSSWALGTPSASVINSAAPSGTQSWATNLSGNFNGSENSFVESPTFDMSALGNPQFRMDVWWDSETSWSGAQVQVSSNGGTSWTTLGSTASGGTNWYPEGSANGNMNTFFTTSGGVDDQWSGAAAAGSGGWVTAEHPLTGLAAQSNVKIRVVFGSDASTNFNGFAFDNIEVFNGAIFEDLAVQSIDSLTTACGLGVETVTITLRNEGSDTIQSNTAIPVTYSDGATTVSETLTLASDLLPQATVTHTFATPVDLSVPGFYSIIAYADLAADTLPANDTAVVNLENILLVNSYPHFENFESGAGGWASGGSNNSWAMGTPAKNVIQGAASGNNAWVTGGLGTGTYNANEQSFVLGPCFDLTNVPADPWIALNVWWESEWSWDGAALQYSTDSGQTWSHHGAFADTANWYRDNAIDGLNWSGDQDGWTGALVAAATGGSQEWLQAKSALDPALIGEPAVRFRVVFGSDGSNQTDGFAFDNFGIAGMPVVNLGNDTSVCSGYVLDPGLDPNGTFTWLDPDSNVLGSLPTFTVINTDSLARIDTISLLYLDPIGLCPPLDTIIITTTQNPTVSIIGFTDATCNGGGDGSATAAGAGGASPYTYSWSSGDMAATASGLIAGTYTVSITDALGCGVDTAQVTISSPASIVASIPVNIGVTCNGGSDGSLTATATGGTTPYSFTWSNGALTATAGNLTAGIYTVSVMDANGCGPAVQSATVIEPTAVVASILSTGNVSCNGGNDGFATASASGGTSPYTFAWSNGDVTATTNNLSAGTVTVTVTDNNGCTGTTTASITEPAALSVGIGTQTDVDCNGTATGSAMAVGSGGTMPYTYTWSNGQGGAMATTLMAATYTVSITDANGCGPSTTSVTITEPTALAATLVSTVNVSCSGGADGAITAGGSGGTPTYTFLWSTGGAGATETGLSAGTYTVTVTDANGCTDALTATVTQPLPLNVAIDSVQDVNCGGADGAIFTSAIGGTMPYTYAWSNGGTTEDIMNLTAGAYTLTLTDANGCSTTVTGTVNQPTTLSAAVVSVTDNLCNGDANGSIQAMATGGITPYTYSWSSGGMAAGETGLMAGTYTLTVTDNNGCFVTADTVVNEPAAVVINLDSVQQVLCNGDSNGFVAVSTTGGVAPYTYAWSNGATSPVLTGLAAGVFSGTVTDANGCSETLSVTISEPMVLTGSVASTVQPLCFGAANGSATVAATGGTMPYTYAWPSGTNGATDTNLTAGMHAVTITDANGCSDQLTVNLTEPALLEVTVTGSNVTCAGDNDGTAMASISGGTFPYTYLWDDPAAQTAAMATGLLEGPVNVTITDANGCTASNGFNVGAANQLPNVSVTADKDTTCRDSAIVLDAGSGFQVYAWSTGATGQQISVDSTGTYGVTVTDNNGCVNNDSIQVVVQGPCVGIADLFDRAGIRYFPNPSDGLLNLEISGLAHEEVTIEVYTLQGQVMVRKTRQLASERELILLDLSPFAQGTYLVRLRSQNSQRTDRIAVH